jgi:hypothetical protein
MGGGWPRPGGALAAPRLLLRALLLCSLLAQPHPSRAFFFFGGVRTSLHVPQVRRPALPARPHGHGILRFRC